MSCDVPTKAELRDSLICQRCHELRGYHLFARNRRRCADGKAFKAGYWTQEEIDAAKDRAALLYAKLTDGAR